jgi:hypothetical protein
MLGAKASKPTEYGLGLRCCNGEFEPHPTSNNVFMPFTLFEKIL